MTAPNKDQIIEILKCIEDPELFLDIYFLGLIYDVRVAGEKSGGPVGPALTAAPTTDEPKEDSSSDNSEELENAEEQIIEPGMVEVDMTFTTPLCPSGPDLIDQVKTGIESLEWVDTVTVKVVFDPPWKPSEDVQAMMGMI